jgi:hypothetical protein
MDVKSDQRVDQIETVLWNTELKRTDIPQRIKKITKKKHTTLAIKEAFCPLKKAEICINLNFPVNSLAKTYTSETDRLTKNVIKYAWKVIMT